MNKTIIATLLARFSKLDFDSAISSFNKTVDRLQALEEARLKEAAEHARTLAEAKAKQLLAQAEADRANATAAKIKALIGSI
jgi:hypothetical protein